MKIRPSCLCLALLASLGARGTTPVAAEELSYSGEVGIALSPSSVSGIPIDVGTLSAQICGGAMPTKPLVECHVIVKNGIIEVQIEEGSATVSGLQLSGAGPLEMPCGHWDTKLTLDSTLPRPASPIALEKRPDDPERGLFAVVLEANTNLHLTSRETGQTADVPLTLGLALAGPWVLAPPAQSQPGRRLLLLADRDGNEIRTFQSCIPESVFQEFDVICNDCKICLEAAAPIAGSGGPHDQT